jgi:hypothetical protein
LQAKRKPDSYEDAGNGSGSQKVRGSIPLGSTSQIRLNQAVSLRYGVPGLPQPSRHAGVGDPHPVWR